MLIIKNRLEELLQAGGFKEFKPSEKLLDDLNMTIHRFNKIIRNKAQPTFEETYRLSQWLGISADMLFDVTKTH